METRAHVHQQRFGATPATLFSLLITPSSIRRWWSADQAIVIPQPGGSWTARWGEHEDDPDYIVSARIAEFDPPNRLVMDQFRYYAKSGPLPFDAEFVTEYRIAEADGGATLTVRQDGFPASAVADDYFAACGEGWQATMKGIAEFLEESPTHAPPYDN